ncbi:MAG TPA: DUF3341 domain-containing protein [Bryobacteraceae bacterium]|nr:DUF3341 domain-containing protein [Bryobacteraceae bacterium]
MKNISVYGIYGTRGELEDGINALRTNSFREEDISILLPENVGNKDLKVEMNSKAPEGIATGGVSGAVLGGALGWLAGIGALAIPGLGPFIAAGPILAALGGVGAGAAVGGLTGGLIGLGMPEAEAKRFEGRVKEGGILISVHADNSEWADRAEKILRASGARDIQTSGEHSADYGKTDRPIARSASF